MSFLSRLKTAYITTATISMISAGSLLYTISSDWSYQNRLEDRLNDLSTKEFLCQNPAKKQYYELRKDKLRTRLDNSVQETSEKGNQLLGISLLMGTAAYLSEKKYSSYTSKTDE